MANKNRIPCNFNRITATQINHDTNGGKSGDVWHIFRNCSGLLGLNTRTGKYYYLFASHLRIAELWQFNEII